jgi:large subunit ribosomal protein L4
MSPLPLLGGDGAASGELELSAPLAAQQIKPHLVHETVVNELARRRRGTHSTKTRAEVRGGGAKPWRQKGTGRARQGSTRSPQWVGGGVVFGPQPRTHGGKVNRKVQVQAFRSALRSHVDRGSVAVMDVAWETPSTRQAAAFLAKAPEGLQVRPLLVVLEDTDGVVARSFRNLAGVYVLHASELQTVDLVAARALLVQRSAWERLSTAGQRRQQTAEVTA